MKAFRTLFVASVTMLRRNRVLLITSLGLALLSIFVFGWLFGSGPGAGMGLLISIAGLVAVAIGIVGYAVPAIYHAETLLPDHDQT